MSQLPFLVTRMDDDRSASKKDNAWSIAIADGGGLDIDQRTVESGPMSELGQSRRFGHVPAMSDVPLTADSAVRVQAD